MQTTTLIKIETKAGKIAAEVTRMEHDNGRVTHQWTGAWGAGCGDLGGIIKSLKVSMASRKGWRVVHGAI